MFSGDTLRRLILLIARQKEQSKQRQTDNESLRAKWQIKCVCVCVWCVCVWCVCVRVLSGVLCEGEVIPLLSYLVVLLSLSASCLQQTQTHSNKHTHTHTHTQCRRILWFTLIVIHSRSHTQHTLCALQGVRWCVAAVEHNVTVFYGGLLLFLYHFSVVVLPPGKDSGRLIELIIESESFWTPHQIFISCIEL